MMKILIADEMTMVRVSLLPWVPEATRLLNDREVRSERRAERE